MHVRAVVNLTNFLRSPLEPYRTNPASLARATHVPGVGDQMDSAVGRQLPTSARGMSTGCEPQGALDNAGEERGRGGERALRRMGQVEISLPLSQERDLGLEENP